MKTRAREIVTFVCDLYFPGIGVIKFASNLKFKKRIPELHFEIAGNKVSFMLIEETDGGTSEGENIKYILRRLLYKPVSPFFGFYNKENDPT